MTTYKVTVDISKLRPEQRPYHNLTGTYVGDGKALGEIYYRLKFSDGHTVPFEKSQLTVVEQIQPQIF